MSGGSVEPELTSSNVLSVGAVDLGERNLIYFYGYGVYDHGGQGMSNTANYKFKDKYD